MVSIMQQQKIYGLLAQVWEVYGHISKIFISIVMWNIAIYAGWSHAVVEVFCLDTIKNLDVRASRALLLF